MKRQRLPQEEKAARPPPFRRSSAAHSPPAHPNSGRASKHTSLRLRRRDGTHRADVIGSPARRAHAIPYCAKTVGWLHRRHEGLYMHLRSGHVSLAAYLARIGRALSPTCPTRGEGPETVYHFLCECQTYVVHCSVHVGAQANPCVSFCLRTMPSTLSSSTSTPPAAFERPLGHWRMWQRSMSSRTETGDEAARRATAPPPPPGRRVRAHEERTSITTPSGRIGTERARAHEHEDRASTRRAHERTTASHERTAPKLHEHRRQQTSAGRDGH